MNFAQQLAPPIKRPHLIQPHQGIDLIHGRVKDLLKVRMALLHGANYNDPAPFDYPSYQQLASSGEEYFGEGWGG
jgi:cyanobactin biosynthesis protein (PatB/AcyB/McaB family)